MSDIRERVADGTLRVWYIPQVPMGPFHWTVPDLVTGREVINALYKFSYFEYKNRVKPDYADAGGIERFEDGEWCEVDESEYGND